MQDVFERAILPHLPAAYRLARWLLGDPAAAEDVVQDAAEKAWRGLGGMRGGSERAWLLRIVRNEAMDMLARRRPADLLDEAMVDGAPDPEAAVLETERRQTLAEALQSLPPVLRECLVLREFEELSYRDIAAVAGVPIGTVMSRLWKARQMLLACTEGLRA